MTWDNFDRDEFGCQCGCGTNLVNDEIIDLAQRIRDIVQFPLPVTSGYRCPKHPVEAAKARPGTHAAGLAVDIGVRGDRARQVLMAALSDPQTQGIGINQRGMRRFVHIDIADDRADLIWTYP